MGFCIFWGVVNVLSVLLPLRWLSLLAAGRGLCRQGLCLVALGLFGAEHAVAQSRELAGGSRIFFQALAMLDAWMLVLLAAWLLAGALVWRWLPRRQAAVLYAAKRPVAMPLGVAAGCLLVFAMLAWVVVYPEHAGHARLMAADAGAQQWAQDHVSAPMRELLHVLTAAGDVRWLAVMVLLVAGWLALGAQWQALWAWVFFIGLNGLAVRLLKNLLDRARPEVLHEMLTSGASFPSGHTSGAVVVYGLLWLALRGRLSPTASRALAWGCALLVATIALSRILLQAHFASDVLAGALLGLAWCALAALVLGRGERQN
jgi:membrane-associated phospholipid phosphatase